MNSIIHSAFSEKSAGDDKGDVYRVTSHDDSVETFEEASLTSSSSCRIHGDWIKVNGVSLTGDLRLGFAEIGISV